jgi:type I restriction enzyme S subunit
MSIYNQDRQKIGNIAKVISGYAFKSEEFGDSGIPVIKIKNIRKGVVDLSDSQRVHQRYLSIDKKYYVNSKDLLISLTGSHITQPDSVVGRVALQSKSAEVCLLNQRAGKFIIKDNARCNKIFLYYTLSTSENARSIALLAHGAASQANVSPSQVENLEIWLPDITIQNKIASILSAYDDLIENNLKRIKILEEMAQMIYKEWFVNFRFPEHENVKMVKSELGMIPEGWEVKKLGDIVEIRKGKNITQKTITEGFVPVVAGGLTPAYYHNQANTRNPVITVSASGANAGVVNLYQEDIWASDCSFIDAEATPFVYYFYLLLKYRQIEVTRLQRGAAQPHVYPKDLMRLEVNAVPARVLEQFDATIMPLFHLIGNLAMKNTNLRKTRDLLLPKLISGEIDVVNLDIKVQEELGNA